jgi:hypothetical protein
MTDNENEDVAALLQQVSQLLTTNQALTQQHLAATERADTLNQFIMRVAGASSVEEVLKRGFETLSSQLEPLRDLTPKRTLLSEAALNQLRHLRTSLDRPDWNDGRAFRANELRAAEAILRGHVEEAEAILREDAEEGGVMTTPSAERVRAHRRRRKGDVGQLDELPPDGRRI